MARHSSIALFCLVGAIGANAGDDSANAAPASRSGADASDSTVAPALPSRTIPLGWLPMEFHRYTSGDLDSGNSVSTGSRSAAGTATVPQSELKFTGSKTVKVGVGGNGGVALDQTLYLTAEGELSPGVRMQARLSDGDIPLSSQGSSASLREVDDIYLAVESDRWNLKLGDQEWKLAPDLGPGADRRLRGLSAGWTGPTTSATGTIGGPQAKWKRVQFQGVQGRQEGYPLASWQGGLHGVIVPGSEKVRINGEAMHRGADADYLVRYGDGLLDFSTHRRISSSDLIEVEFQSADLDYERTFAAGHAGGTNRKLRWEGWAVREGDDATRPLAYAPDSATRRILSLAGSDSLNAKTELGQILPLPNQTGEAGFRLRLGDSSLWIGTDLRGTDFDANVASTVDSRIGGFFGTGALGFQRGEYVTRDGAGKVSAMVKGQRIDAGFHGLSDPDSLGSGNEGLWSATGPGERTSGEGMLGWKLLPGIGWDGEAGGRWAPGGWTQRIKSTLGLDRGADKQILSSQEWTRSDDGIAPLEGTRSTTRLAWPVATVVPSLELNTRTLDQTLAVSGATAPFDRRNLASLETRGGAVWRPAIGGLELGLQAISRSDAVRPNLQAGNEDTARSVGANSRFRWSPALGDLDLEMDWKQTRIRPVPSLPWVATQSWLGSANAGFWPTTGVRGQGSWKLSSSSYQPEIPRYDTVPVGTGTYRYDTLLRIVVPSDLGDLRLAGTRLDTSRPAVLASQRSLSIEGQFEPGKVLPDLGGFLADIGMRGHAQWEETDSTAADRIWPHFTDDGLGTAITGRSDLSAAGWWTRERKRLEFEWTRTLAVQSSPAVSRLRSMEEALDWSSSTESGHRLDIAGRHGDLRDAQIDRLRLETYWSLDPSLGLRIVRSVEIRPGWRSKWSQGSEKTTTFRAELQAPYATVRADLPRNLSLRAELRRVIATADDLAGSRLTEGYPDGVTWRTSSSLDWTWKDHIQAKAEWVARKEPGQPWFQKLSGEAKAVF